MIYRLKRVNNKGQECYTDIKLSQEELNNIVKMMYDYSVESTPLDEIVSFYLYSKED